jgi:hypothetical protein
MGVPHIFVHGGEIKVNDISGFLSIVFADLDTERIIRPTTLLLAQKRD